MLGWQVVCKMTVGFLLWGIYCGKYLNSKKVCDTRVPAKKSFCSPTKSDFLAGTQKKMFFTFLLSFIFVLISLHFSFVNFYLFVMFIWISAGLFGSGFTLWCYGRKLC